MQELQNAVIQNIQLDLQDGQLSEDSQKMLEYIDTTSISTTDDNDSTSFGSLTNNWIATNPDGSYDYSVPEDALVQIDYDALNENANNYGFVEEAIA